MADNKLITMGLLGVAGYLAYRYVSQGAGKDSSAPITNDVSVKPIPAFTSLDAIYERFSKVAGSEPFTVHGFNHILQKELPAGKAVPAPDDVFTAPGFDADAPMTISQYWGVMAPYLKANLGLSGYGLYGGLGMIARGLY